MPGFPETGEQPESIHTGHHDVKDEGIGVKALCHCESFFSGRCRGHLKPLVFKADG